MLILRTGVQSLPAASVSTERRSSNPWLPLGEILQDFRIFLPERMRINLYPCPAARRHSEFRHVLEHLLMRLISDGKIWVLNWIISSRSQLNRAMLINFLHRVRVGAVALAVASKGWSV